MDIQKICLAEYWLTFMSLAVLNLYVELSWSANFFFRLRESSGYQKDRIVSKSAFSI